MNDLLFVAIIILGFSITGFVISVLLPGSDSNTHAEDRNDE